MPSNRFSKYYRAIPVSQPYFTVSGGSVADVESIRRLGDYYFGINGIVTFKNSGLASVLPAIGLDRILTETDSPYLAPVPYRGRRNESAYIPHIVDRIAESIEIPADNVANTTTENAIKILPGFISLKNNDKHKTPTYYIQWHQ